MVKVAETHVFLKKPSSCNMNYHSLVDAVKVTASYKTSCSRGKNRESIENKEGWKRRDRVVLKNENGIFCNTKFKYQINMFSGTEGVEVPGQKQIYQKGR
jgi:hypothetical protein